jgi:signal transduction histidine kinase
MEDARIDKGRSLKLRDKLFLSYSLLSVVILLAAAWAINSQVVAQARQQVREEMKASLSLYDAVWEEQAGRLSALGMAMAGSPIVKTIFGDPRASRDKETIRQMLAEFDRRLSENVDLVLISDSGGGIIYAESPNADLSRIQELPGARAVAEHQHPAQSFILLGGQLFHLAVTPVILHSGSVGVDNTMAVLVAGSELNRRTALELKQRAHSDVLFFAGDRLYASSLEPEVEMQAAKTIAALAFGREASDQSAELTIAGEDQLAFAHQLSDSDGRPVGYVVVLHSLAGASMLFHAISSRLMLVGTTSVVLTLLVSYFIARRITRPIEFLVVGARELGQGKYESRIDVSPSGEIGQLASAFEQMRQSIKQGQAVLLRNERLATVGQMASGIIHDLRSPLAAVSTAADLFANAALSPEQRQILANSQVRAAQRMGAMLKELLEFSRGRYQLKIEEQALAPLISYVVSELITPEVAPGVTVEMRIPPELRVRVDGERARRMFENLLINSLQAMPEGGAITIRASEDGQKVRINIVDSGSGIPLQLRERLFEPFASVGKSGGTGLGLAIARSIAEAHGGLLTLVSANEEPADFCIELPLYFEARHGKQDSAG